MYTADDSTLSSSNIALASFWLKSCLHGQSTVCRSLATCAVSPRRTINIRDPDRPFLQDKGNRQIGYVALSYKWGTSKRYMSLVTNVHEHYRAIALDALPKTFFDAIYVAHNLGFSHLWIDALCIVQDLEEERNEEIQNMGDIFRGAVLTLFAEDADNADAGLSRARDPRCIRPCKIELQVACREIVSLMSLYVRKEPTRLPKARPLKQRGWVLQEEVLSPRGLHFGSDQIWWDCHCFTSRESFPDLEKDKSLTETAGYWSTTGIARNDFGILRCLLKFQKRARLYGNKSKEIFRAWYNLVHVYCQRELTFVSDILPALTGLAMAVAKSHNLQYVNGIWKEDI
ncbi:heterokaryon incompatibility protein-domain-containing protein, partial [Paraphoma chrysanthemicola]